MSKTVFFDIDGTLWDERMNIPDSTIEAIAALKANGHRAFLCTGRARASVNSDKLLNMGFDGMIAACGNYIEMDDKVIYEKDLSCDMVEKIIRVLSECRMPVVLEGSTDYWIDDEGFEDDPYVDYLFESLGEHAHIIRGYEGDIRVNKFSADIIDGTDYERVKKEFSDDFLILEHEENVVEFVPRGTSKGNRHKMALQPSGYSG